LFRGAFPAAVLGLRALWRLCLKRAGREDGACDLGFQAGIAGCFERVEQTRYGLRHHLLLCLCRSFHIAAGRRPAKDFGGAGRVVKGPAHRADPRRGAGLALCANQCQKISFRVLNGKNGAPNSLALAVRQGRQRYHIMFCNWRLCMHFRPLHDRVVVRRIDAEEKTSGGIIIPDTAREKPQEGEVVAVGPGLRDESGKLIELSVKAGDRILFGKWSGTEVKIGGEELLIMKESDILGVVDTVVPLKQAA